MPERRVIGLTGGIGVGKSTVAAMLAERGATIVDCDDLGRQVVEPDGRAFGPLVETFGPGILGPDGRVDRPALGAIVFTDPGALATLNEVTHPAIDVEIGLAIDAAAGRPIVLDMAVLTESDLGKGHYHEVLVVEAPLAVRLERLRTNRGMAEEQAMARIISQATDAQRRAIADHLLMNDGTEADLRAAVGALWDREGFGR
ncbi:MAG: dephospho-CoA kinase [Actinomycetota bacterium]